MGGSCGADVTIDESNGSKVTIIANDKHRWKCLIFWKNTKLANDYSFQHLTAGQTLKAQPYKP